jgi:5-methylcytosine-specific restriction endonuclease McrA
MKKPKILYNFYKSTVWQVARQIKYQEQNGKCERCGKVGEEVQHKVRLTVDNVKDSTISIKQENLELLCKDCHNKEHKRFTKEKEFDSDGNLIPR